MKINPHKQFDDFLDHLSDELKIKNGQLHCLTFRVESAKFTELGAIYSQAQNDQVNQVLEKLQTKGYEIMDCRMSFVNDVIAHCSITYK
ncbi:hypothetical protein [Lactococcus sp.]|uniref:hypothetical protein n=1 Tax=Lactococcus sp. TaxID=44273 RepID=UPI0035B2F170